jgi:hypothetical protein
MEEISYRVKDMLSYIKENRKSVAANNISTLMTCRYIEDFLSSIDKSIFDNYNIHNIFIVYIVVKRIVEGDSFIREVVIYDLEYEMMTLPYSIVANQYFLLTINKLTVMLELPQKLDYNLLDKLIIKKD